MSDLFWNILERYPVEESNPDSQFFLTFNTNGTLLNSTNIARLLSSRIKKIRISIDSPNKDLYHKIRGYSLERILAAVRGLVDARNSINRQFPKIAIEMTLMKENISEVCEMIDLCKDLGVDFLELWSLNEQPDNTLDQWNVRKGNWEFDYRKQLLSNFPPNELKEIVDGFHSYANSRSLPITSWIQGELIESEGFSNLKPFIEDSKDVPNIPWEENSIRCMLPWVELRMTYTGEVHPCCWSPQPIGSLRKEPLESIWNNEAIQQMRSDLIEGKIPELCSGASCPFLKGRQRSTQLEWNVSTSNLMEVAVVPDTFEGVFGFFPMEKHDERFLRWTDGNAQCSIHLKGPTAPRSIRIRSLHFSPPHKPVQIIANDVVIHDAPLPLAGLDAWLKLPPLDGEEKLVIRIISEPFHTEGDSRQLGIAIESLMLSDIEVLSDAPQSAQVSTEKHRSVITMLRAVARKLLR